MGCLYTLNSFVLYLSGCSSSKTRSFGLLLINLGARFIKAWKSVSRLFDRLTTCLTIWAILKKNLTWIFRKLWVSDSLTKLTTKIGVTSLGRVQELHETGTVDGNQKSLKLTIWGNGSWPSLYLEGSNAPSQEPVLVHRVFTRRKRKMSMESIFYSLLAVFYPQPFLWYPLPSMYEKINLHLP